MLCCTPAGYKKLCKTDGLVLVHAPPPRNPTAYLPGLVEYKPQTQLEDAIDDPSSVFFDPNERPGFVYKAIASYTFQYETNTATLDESELRAITRLKSKSSTNSTNDVEVDSPNSSVFDDSLDMSSLPNSPLRLTDDSFEGNFNSESRRNSLELDPMGIGEYHATPQATNGSSAKLNTASRSRSEMNKENMRLFTEPGNSSVMDKFNDIHLYDDEIFNEARIQNRANYASDAESVKTYQDSGIYEDENFESPKAMNAEGFPTAAHQIVFGGHDDSEKDVPLERYSVFKTPSASRESSSERPTFDKGMVPPTMQAIAREANPTKTKATRPRSKSSSKYSHIQAKVECHRSHKDRSLSPGPSATHTKVAVKNAVFKPMSFSKHLNATLAPVEKKASMKSKNSLSDNVRSGSVGNKKIFKQHLDFRRKAEPRTDTHGVEMYTHLPKEFQEIARRLARQDLELKRQEKDKLTRGRSLSRSRSSSIAASSRNSSVSPTRGRSRTRKEKWTEAENATTKILQDTNVQKTTGSPAKSISRTSSVRSIPSTPHLSSKHPATSTTLYDNKKPSKSRASSAGSSRSQSPSRSRSNSRPGSRSGSRSSSPQRSNPKQRDLSRTSNPTSPVSQLYQFSKRNSFGSPKQYKSTSLFQVIPAQ